AVDEIYVLAVQGEALDAGVAAVGDGQDGGAAALVHDQTVRAVELARVFAEAAEGPDILAVLIVLVDVAGAVTVAHIDIAVGRDGDIGGTVFLLLALGVRLVGFGFIGVADAPYLLAGERGLDHHAARRIAEMQELLLALGANVQAVCAALELLAPGAHELAFGIEDHHGVVRFTSGIHGVVNVDVAVSVLADAVGIAVLDVGGQHAPVVDGFVAVRGLAQHGLGAAGFVRRVQDQRG